MEIFWTYLQYIWSALFVGTRINIWGYSFNLAQIFILDIVVAMIVIVLMLFKRV